MLPTPEQEAVTVVFVGAFNPRAFHPEWFGKHRLVRPAEVEEAVASPEFLMLPDYAAIRKLGPFSLDIGLDQMVITATDRGQDSALRDLVVGMLRLLPEAPILAVGINHGLHWKARDGFDYRLKTARFQLQAAGAPHAPNRLEWRLPGLAGDTSARILRLERSAFHLPEGIFAFTNAELRGDHAVVRAYVADRFDEALATSQALIEEVLA